MDLTTNKSYDLRFKRERSIEELQKYGEAARGLVLKDGCIFPEILLTFKRGEVRMEASKTMGEGRGNSAKIGFGL